MFPGPLDVGLYKKAREKKLWSLEIVNIRDYATDKHKTVDDTPFGGGSSMLMRADVIANSLDKNISNKNEPIIYLTPKGKKFDQTYAKKIIEAGEVITEDMVWVKRPAPKSGCVPAKDFHKIIGKKTVHRLDVGQQIRWKDLVE